MHEGEVVSQESLPRLVKRGRSLVIDHLGLECLQETLQPRDTLLHIDAQLDVRCLDEEGQCAR